MDAKILKTYEASLARCSANPNFAERFYVVFLASSPKVAEKFAKTDFVRQRKALDSSLHWMLSAVSDGAGGPERHLKELAERHSRHDLNIGAEMYDYWLDSLLATVKEIDPEYGEEVRDAWERVMLIGIEYMLSRYA
jgi:hemoglobin-like flavoprotein